MRRPPDDSVPAEVFLSVSRHVPLSSVISVYFCPSCLLKTDSFSLFGFTAPIPLKQEMRSLQTQLLSRHLRLALT